jgi:tRNA-2-methylthio-N6-dimethylallyladenosine synthase
MSSHPKDFTNELIDCIARNPKIERNIHLPMQSGSNKILKLMNRKYTVEQYLEKITNLRETVSDVRITTDIICGFPGETEADFDQTVQVVKQVKFNAAFIFAYSPREGTVAADMEGQLDDKTKRARATNLLAIQRQLNVK